MDAITLAEDSYIVIHGGDDDEVIYLEMEASQIITTGRPHVEIFTDEAEAKARAEELGYVFPDPEPLEPLE